MLANARKDHSIPLLKDETDKIAESEMALFVHQWKTLLKDRLPDGKLLEKINKTSLRIEKAGDKYL